MITVLPFNRSQSMVGTFVPYEVIEEIFTRDDIFEDLYDRIYEDNEPTYFIEHKGLVFKIANSLHYVSYFVGFLIDGTLEFDDDGNMKTCSDIKKLKELLSNIGVSSKITYQFA